MGFKRLFNGLNESTKPCVYFFPPPEAFPSSLGATVGA